MDFCAGISEEHIAFDDPEWVGWRYGTQSLKPAIEPIYVGQKPFERGLTGTGNVLKWGVGGLNIDGCRVEAIDSQLAEKYASVQNAEPRKNNIYGTDGRDRAESAPHAQGRWPANIILSVPENEYELNPFTSTEQKRELYRWLSENA